MRSKDVNKEASPLYTTLSCSVMDISFTGAFDYAFFDTNIVNCRPHAHSKREVHIVESGEYVLENLDGTVTYSVKPGFVAIIPPGYYHNVHTKRGEAVQPEKVCKYVVRFDFDTNRGWDKADKIYDLFAEIMSKTDKEIYLFEDIELTKYIVALRNSLNEGKVAGEMMADAYYKLIMTRIVLDVTQNSSDVDAYRRNVVANDLFTRRELVERFLDDNYSNPKLSAAMLAKCLNLSVRQMNRVVSEYYGTSFMQMLANLRLSHAKKMLIKTDLSVSEIATKVGYASTTGFFVSFKKKYGKTPGEFRAESGLSED